MFNVHLNWDYKVVIFFVSPPHCDFNEGPNSKRHNMYVGQFNPHLKYSFLTSLFSCRCFPSKNNPNITALKVEESRHDEEFLAKQKKKKRRKEAGDDIEKNLRGKTETPCQENPHGDTGDSDVCVVSNVDPTGLDSAVNRTSSSNVGENCKPKRKRKKKIKENNASQKMDDKSREKKKKRLKQA